MAVRSRNIMGPSLLVGLGTLLLLNNLEVLPWSIWREAWQYWPILLILAGAAFLLDSGSGRPFHILGWVVVILVIWGVVTIVVSLGPGSEYLGGAGCAFAFLREY